MKTAIYAAAISFAVLVASDSYEEESVGCPFKVAINESGIRIPVVCSQHCHNGIDTIDNGTPCYAIGKEVFQRMTPILRYACPLGVCQNGTCVATEMYETCYRTKRQQLNFY
ncbi:evasin-1-like isoform X2 [Dermacentor variabilis]|uniref:evasin-1-like isoform X2 n=1 Tax=Dermacentor variabilis TaxID=34621 RepID=UPI003F5CA701